MTSRRVLGGVMAAAMAGGIVLWPATAAAQRAAQVSVGAGSATDERGVRSTALTVAPMVTMMPGAHVAISLAANATKFESASWTVGGWATVASRTNAVAGTAFSLNAGVGMSRSSFGATFTVADATPAIEWTVKDVTVVGGVRVASGETRMKTSPSSLPLPNRATLVSVRRMSMGPTFGGQWRVMGNNAAWPITVSYREERAKVDSIPATDRAVGASLSYGWLALSGSAAGRFVAAGLSVRFGAAREHGLPAPKGARRAGNGVWYVDVPLAPGEYRYAFRVNQVEWRAPKGWSAEGYAKGSSETTILASAGKVKANMEATQEAMVAAGRALAGNSGVGGTVGGVVKKQP